MGFLTQVTATEEKNKLQEAFKALVLKRADMLAWYAKKLASIFEGADENFEVSAALDTSLLVKALTKLDDDFAEKEVVFWREYRLLVQQSKKLLLAEKKEALDLALASLKNRMNISITFVSDEAKDKLPQARQLEVSGAVIARMEYLSELTLEKQIKTFDGILKEV